MDEKILELILSELKEIKGTVKNLEGRFDHLEGRINLLEQTQHSHGEHIQQLIRIVGNTNAKFEELTEEVEHIKDILHTFRSETDVNFRKLDRRIKLIESDLDETMSKVGELTQPRI